MSRPISDQEFRADHPRDKRFEQMRSLAAEQQALRLQRQQEVPQSNLIQNGFQFNPGEVRQLAADGLVGSKRLAENLEGMLRDKPKFNFFQTNDANSSQAEEAGSSEQSQIQAEPAAFVPGEAPFDLGLANRRPPTDAENPNSRDLNLSKQNRQQALTQGLPSTQSGRAAAELFRQAPAPEASTQAEGPPQSQPESASTGTSSESAPALTSSSASSTAADDSALASRGAVNFDRGRISTASDALGETRGVTDNQLVLHHDAPEQADLAVRQELGRQSAAEDESKRRGDTAQSSLDTARGREGQLNSQKDQLEGAKGQQRAFAADSAAALERDNQLLDQQTQSINATQRAGENSLARISQLDSQVEENTRVRDQASTDLSSSQQSINQLQSQVSSLQNAPTPKAPGNGKGQGNQAKQESANAAAAQQQQAVSSAQTQLAAAQKQQEDAQKRQQEAASAIQTSQAEAQAERTSLDQSRAALNTQQDLRKGTQERSRAHGLAAQEDQDRSKDLASHSQDLKAQFDEVAAAKDQAATSLRKNRDNQSAAHENVQQLRSLQTDLDEPKDPSRQEQQVSDKSNRPEISETNPSTQSSEASSNTGSQGGNTQVRRSGRDTVVQLNSLNQGSNATSKDNLSSVSKNRGGVGDGGDLGEASLAAAAAASTPRESGSSSSQSLGSSEGSGRGHGNDEGGSPGHSGEAPGHNKGHG